MAEPMFAAARVLLEQYIDTLRRFEPTIDVEHDAIVEARLRLEQLDYLTARVHELEARKMSRDSADQLSMLVLLYTESFYYVAARLEALCQKHKALGLSGYTCRTVTLIRNKIIEHPEEADGHPLISWSWQHDDGRGPVLEGRAPTTRKLVLIDPGLFRNAEDVRLTFEETVRTATQHVEEALSAKQREQEQKGGA